MIISEKKLLKLIREESNGLIAENVAAAKLQKLAKMLTPKELAELAHELNKAAAAAPLVQGVQDASKATMQQKGTVKEEEIEEIFGANTMSRGDQKVIQAIANIPIGLPKSKWTKEHKELYAAAKKEYIEGDPQGLRAQLSMSLTDKRSVLHVKNPKIQKAMEFATGCKNLVPACIAKSAGIAVALSAIIPGSGAISQIAPDLIQRGASAAAPKIKKAIGGSRGMQREDITKDTTTHDT